MKAATILLSASIGAATFSLARNSQPAAILTLGFVLAGIEIYLLSKSAGGFTPAVVPVVAVNVTLLAGLVGWQKVSEVAYVSAILPNDTSFLMKSAVIGILFCVGYTAGALLAGPRWMKVSAAQIGRAMSQFGKSKKLPHGALVVTGYGGLILTIYAWQGALIQARYNQYDGPTWAVSLSSIIAPLAILALTLTAVERGPWRVLALVGLGLFLVILFASAKRTIVMFPLMLLLAVALHSDKRIRGSSIALSGAAAVLLLQVPLVGRRNPDGVGIIPLGEILIRHPEKFVAEIDLGGLAGNILFSTPLTAAVAEQPIPSVAFWTSVNPMPGGAAGWDQIRDSLRVNYFTPYNALGELAAQGWLVLVLSAAAAGFILTLSTRIAARLPGNFRFAAVILVLAITALFSLSVLQYNLRSTARLVWYCFIGVGIIWLAASIFRQKKIAVAASLDSNLDELLTATGDRTTQRLCPALPREVAVGDK